ncbi:MAG: hypothetical protein Q9227_008524 [Pyrenula ochraceoflavens]
MVLRILLNAIPATVEVILHFLSTYFQTTSSPRETYVSAVKTRKAVQNSIQIYRVEKNTRLHKYRACTGEAAINEGQSLETERANLGASSLHQTLLKGWNFFQQLKLSLKTWLSGQLSTTQTFHGTIPNERQTYAHRLTTNEGAALDSSIDQRSGSQLTINPYQKFIVMPDLRRPLFTPSHEQVTCSCRVKAYNVDDPSTFERPKKVALHNATDHWRPVEQRRTPRSASEYVAAQRQKAQEQAKAAMPPPSRSKMDFAEERHRGGRRQSFNPTPAMNPDNELPSALSHTHAHAYSTFYAAGGNNGPGLTESSIRSSDSLADQRRTSLVELKGEALVNAEKSFKSPVMDVETTKSWDKIVQSIPSPHKDDIEATMAKPPDTPKPLSASPLPNLLRGKIVPSRLLHSEQNVSAQHRSAKGETELFEGRFTAPVRRPYTGTRDKKGG